MALRISSGPVNGSIKRRDRPSSKAACASEPTVPGRPCLSANSPAKVLKRASMQRELKTSTASTKGRISNKSSRLQAPLRISSNGWDTLIKAPCSFKRRIVSCGVRPAGISCFTKEARISPFVVIISSPIMIRSGSIACASRAPAIELWSVTTTRSMPLRRAAATRSAGRVRESLDAWVWQ